MNITNETYETVLGFIESEEMRQCFREKLLAPAPHITEEVTIDICCECILNSRAAVGEKLAALRKLPPCNEVDGLIKVAETAMDDKKQVEGNVFLVTAYICADPHEGTCHCSNVLSEREPFLSFDAAAKWISRKTPHQCEIHEISPEQCMELIWYEIEKFIPDNENNLLLKITWTLNAKGEIMFFELGDDFKEYFDNKRLGDYVDTWFAWEGQQWYYPSVPFDFGDIITIDMRPFFEEFRGVIVRIGDNHDCCAIACVYCDESGSLHCDTLKHNMLCVLSKVSPLYRAKLFTGELPENEKNLKIISEAIKKIPSSKEPG